MHSDVKGKVSSVKIKSEKRGGMRLFGICVVKQKNTLTIPMGTLFEELRLFVHSRCQRLSIFHPTC